MAWGAALGTQAQKTASEGEEADHILALQGADPRDEVWPPGTGHLGEDLGGGPGGVKEQLSGARQGRGLPRCDARLSADRLSPGDPASSDLRAEANEISQVMGFLRGMPVSEEARAHSGEHVLFQSLSRVFRGMESVKVVLGPGKKQLFVRYSGEIDWDGVLEAEKLANRVIREDRRIRVVVGDREEVRRRYGRRLRGRWDLIKDKQIRIVEVENFDYVACKGEHVQRTGEIGFIVVKGFRKTRRGEYEIQFEVGERAWEYALESKRLAMRLVEILGTTPEIAEETARNLREEAQRLRRSLREASKRALENLKYEEVRGVRVYSGVFEGLDRRELVKRAADLRKEGKTVVVLGDLSGFLVMGRSDDLGFNVIPLLEKGCRFLGGRCGGREKLAFGGGFKSKDLREAVDLIKRELTKIL
ncbi:hypothetical protein DRO56_00545 [Candidatus Bathyarchaeota archaeon]|nr:MAG: hypothetical protein DRO56_00545 [Candidatus Bathyarchaeota archaeon]